MLDSRCGMHEDDASRRISSSSPSEGSESINEARNIEKREVCPRTIAGDTVKQNSSVDSSSNALTSQGDIYPSSRTLHFSVWHPGFPGVAKHGLGSPDLREISSYLETHKQAQLYCGQDKFLVDSSDDMKVLHRELILGACVDTRSNPIDRRVACWERGRFVPRSRSPTLQTIEHYLDENPNVELFTGCQLSSAIDTDVWSRRVSIWWTLEMNCSVGDDSPMLCQLEGFLEKNPLGTLYCGQDVQGELCSAGAQDLTSGEQLCSEVSRDRRFATDPRERRIPLVLNGRLLRLSDSPRLSEVPQFVCDHKGALFVSEFCTLQRSMKPVEGAFPDVEYPRDLRDICRSVTKDRVQSMSKRNHEACGGCTADEEDSQKLKAQPSSCQLVAEKDPPKSTFAYTQILSQGFAVDFSKIMKDQNHTLDGQRCLQFCSGEGPTSNPLSSYSSRGTADAANVSELHESRVVPFGSQDHNFAGSVGSEMVAMPQEPIHASGHRQNAMRNLRSQPNGSNIQTSSNDSSSSSEFDCAVVCRGSKRKCAQIEVSGIVRPAKSLRDLKTCPSSTRLVHDDINQYSVGPFVQDLVEPISGLLGEDPESHETSSRYEDPILPEVANEDDEHFANSSSMGAVNIYSDQDLSMELHNILASMSVEDHVPVWDKVTRSAISGRRAPKLRNLRSFLVARPSFEILDVSGIHKKYFRGQSSAMDAEKNPPGTTAESRTRHVLSSEMFLEKARESACVEARYLAFKIANVIGSLRAGDPVPELRCKLEEVVESVGGYDGPLASLREGKLLTAAIDLLKQLTELDVYGFFSFRDEVFGLPDLTLIREMIESGDIWSISDVCIQFRLMVACYLEYYTDGTVFFGAAERLLVEGERVIRRFRDHQAVLYGHDVALAKMKQICLVASRRATKMGFNLEKLVSQKCVKLQNEQSLFECSDESEDPCASTEDDDGHVIECIDPADANDRRINIIEQQQKVAKSKSNLRDENGFSFMGKRESIKVFGLALHRPGFDVRYSESRESLNVYDGSDKSFSAVKPYEVNCHICRRIVDDPASNALCCSNQRYGMCQKIFCLQCLTATVGFDENEFVQVRNPGTWICCHCRSACDEKSSYSEPCTREVATNSCRDEAVRIIWSSQIPVAYNRFPVEVNIFRCRGDGVYEASGRTFAGRLETIEQKYVWIFSCSLMWGLYRCRLTLNGCWFGSFAIRILPVRTCNDYVAACETNHAIGQDAVRISRTKGKPRIRWELTPAIYRRGKESSAWDLPISLKSGPIRICSRTEGYDWRAAKLYPTVKWTGSICGEVPIIMHDDVCRPTLKYLNDRLSNTPSHYFAYSIGHRPHAVATLTELDRLRYSVKYDDMVLNSLWGIVTGRSNIHGIGLFTLTGYSKGDFVIEYAGELIRTAVGEIRDARYKFSGFRGSTYLFKVNEDYIVDATMKSNRARFINHSCDPNMEAIVVSVQGRDLVVLTATRMILPYAELTLNYQLPLEKTKVNCLCKSWRCIGVIN
jgi:SET domain/BRK domain